LLDAKLIPSSAPAQFAGASGTGSGPFPVGDQHSCGETMTIAAAGRSLSRLEFIALVASMMALNAMAIDIMLPAFDAIGEALSVDDPNHIQFVLTSYFLGFGIGQLFLGPISDRFGRRAPLIWGLGLYIIAAFAAAYSPSFAAMLILRTLQGLGASATRIVAMAVVRDTFTGRAMAEVMSLVFVVFMAVPVVAPAIGQVIVLFAPWQFIFLAMVVMASVVTIWAWIRLPETLAPENKRTLRFSVIIEGFEIVLSDRKAMMYGLAPGVIFGALFGFLNTVQPIYTQIYGLGALFPFAFGAVAIVMAASSLLNARLVGRFGMHPLSHGALLCFIALSTVWFVISLFGTMPLWLFMALIASLMFLFGFIANNFNSLAMEPLGKVAGTASSVFGFLQTAGGAITGAIIGQAYNGSVTPIALGYMVLGLMALGMVLIAERGRLFHTEHAPI
jgi:MFS transporter, DHA1 family, multidrug resistance protein